MFNVNMEIYYRYRQNEAETSSFRGFFDNVNQSSVEEPTKDKSTMTTFEPSFLTVVHQVRESKETRKETFVSEEKFRSRRTIVQSVSYR